MFLKKVLGNTYAKRFTTVARNVKENLGFEVVAESAIVPAMPDLFHPPVNRAFVHTLAVSNLRCGRMPQLVGGVPKIRSQLLDCLEEVEFQVPTMFVVHGIWHVHVV